MQYLYFLRTAAIFICLLVFGPPAVAQERLSLQEAIDFALENNITLQQGALNLERNEWDVKRGYANYWPTLNANGRHNYNFGRTIDPLTNLYVTERIQTNFFSLNSDLILFNGLSNLHNLRQSKNAYISGEYTLQDLEQTIMLDVVSMYLQVLMSHEQENRLTKQLESTQYLLDQAMVRIRAGSENPVRELELKATLSTNESLLVEAQANREQGLLSLKRYINMDLSREIELVRTEIPDSLDPFEEADIAEVWENAVARQPEVQAASFQEIAAFHSFKAAQAGLYPRLFLNLSLNSGYSSNARDIDILGVRTDTIGQVLGSSEYVVTEAPDVALVTSGFGNQLADNFGQSVGFSLSVPIFNNLQVRYNMQMAQINRRQAELEYDQIVVDAKNKIYQAYNDMRLSFRKYVAARNQYLAQEALMRQSQVRFDEGLLSSFDWNIMQNDLVTSQADFLQAKYEYLFRTKIFDFYLGKPITLQ
ncbi:MAG: TolC family protein [Bacteroidia bacterium]